jgi:hypothetical protein
MRPDIREPLVEDKSGYRLEIKRQGGKDAYKLVGLERIK